MKKALTKGASLHHILFLSDVAIQIHNNMLTNSQFDSDGNNKIYGKKQKKTESKVWYRILFIYKTKNCCSETVELLK